MRRAANLPEMGSELALPVPFLSPDLQIQTVPPSREQAQRGASGIPQRSHIREVGDIGLYHKRITLPDKVVPSFFRATS